MKKFLLCVSIFVFSCSQSVYAFEPNDPYYDQQWYNSKINVEDAWDITMGGNEVVVAIIDTVMSTDHEDINYYTNDNEIPDDGIDNDENGYIDDYRGWDFVENDNDVTPKSDEVYAKGIINHGTLISGIIGAIGNNKTGIAGINWKVKILPLRIMDNEGIGDSSAARMAVEYAIAQGVDVINMSLISIDDYTDPNLNKSIAKAYNKGILTVVSAGNADELVYPNGVNLNEEPLFPVCYTFDGEENLVVGVAGVDQEDKKLFFSNYGSDCIMVSAPGIKIFSTNFYDANSDVDNEPYGGFYSGTSFSAPLVTGAIAYMKAINNTLSSKQQIDFLKKYGVNIDAVNTDYKGQLGNRIDIGQLINAVFEYTQLNNTHYVIAPFSKKEPIVKLYNPVKKQNINFLAYAENFDKGVRLAVGDLNNNGSAEIVSGVGPGGGPQVRVFNEDGQLLSQFFAYDENFRGGVEVAVGDVDGDNVNEIITSPGIGGGPHIRIFDYHGNLKGQFFAYDASFRNGVQLAAGDINGDGVDEIITGPTTGTTLVRIFNNYGELQGQFFAYGEQFTGGVTLAAGDVDGKGFDEIITGAGVGGGPHVRIFNQRGEVISQFFAFNLDLRTGISVHIGDTDNDKIEDIVVTPISGAAPHVQIYDYIGTFKRQFFAFKESFNGGAVVIVR